MADRKGSYVEPSLSAVLKNGSEIQVGDRWRSRFALKPVIDDAADDASLEGNRTTRPLSRSRDALSRCTTLRRFEPLALLSVPRDSAGSVLCTASRLP